MLAVGTTEAIVVPSARSAEPAHSLTAPTGVRLIGRWFEEPVQRAVHGAAARLAQASCAAVLDDFRDRTGRPLRSRLEALDLDVASYARMVLFYDGSNESPCRRPRVYAFTAPNSRVVRACPALGRLAATEPERAEAVVIHELLHTLGLEEDPPSSEEITALVERRCLRAFEAAAVVEP
jgi:hypothetical protein